MIALALACSSGTGTVAGPPGGDPTTTPGDSAPTGDTGAGDSGSPGDPTLTVDDGWGGGTYPAGTPLHVWADVDPQAAIVTGWTGDAALLDAPLEWNAGLVMPDRDATVAPTIEAVPLAIEARRYALDGGERDVLVVPADAPVGLVVFFHGASYDVDQLRSNAAATLVRHLHRAGYVVVALESELEAANGTGGWTSSLSSSRNGDLRNVEALLPALDADGTAPAGLPVVAWGMSSGAIFAHTVGAAGLASVVVAYCAAGTSEATDATGAATAWYVAAADRTIPSSPADAAADQDELAARGVPTDLVVHPALPLYDQRFLRVAGVDATTSAAIADALRAAGAVGPDDQWLLAGTEAVAAIDLAALGLDAAQQVAVGAEIEILAADHELYDDLAARMVAFVDANAE